MGGQATVTVVNAPAPSTPSGGETEEGSLNVTVVNGSVTEDELRSTPLEVKIIEEIDDPDALVDAFIDLRYAMDKANNMPLFVEVANPGRRDINQAAIPSDAPNAISWSSISATNFPLTIDTTGYQSVVIQKTTAGIITVTVSNDGVTWYATAGCLGSTPQTMIANMPAALGVYVYPVTAKFFRLTGPASLVSCLIYLRSAPMVPLGTIGTVSAVTTLKQLNGTDIVNSTLAGTLAVGGAVASGIVPTTNHIMTGGIDQGRLNTPGAVTAAFTPKTRRALVDELGRFIPPNMDTQLPLNFLGQASALVKDVSQHEGNSLIEIMYHILIELRTLNHQIHELPISIGAGTMNPTDDLSDIRTEMKRYNYDD